MFQEFTYVSDMNGSRSTIDHFIISNSLLNYVDHSDLRDDNHSVHLSITLYMYIFFFLEGRILFR